MEGQDHNACGIVPVDGIVKHIHTIAHKYRPKIHLYTYTKFVYFRHVPDTMSYDDYSIACNTFTFNSFDLNGMKMPTPVQLVFDFIRKDVRSIVLCLFLYHESFRTTSQKFSDPKNILLLLLHPSTSIISY